jgi:hypothetical protein
MGVPLVLSANPEVVEQRGPVETPGFVKALL